MPVIVISGKPGCGSSTNAKLLAKKLKLKHFSVGDYNKRHAKKAKKETDKSIEMWHHKEKYLKKFHLDSDKFANEIAKRDNVVIDAKLGVHLIKRHDLTVWLTASKKVQAERYAKRDKIPVKEAMDKVVEKEKLERANWKRIYGFDYFHQAKEADLVINTGDETPEEITDIIISKLNEKIFQKIWVLALPYQDKRDDKGHAETVTQFAKKLLEKETGNPRVVIPAAILHDIGWSKVSRKESMSVVSGKLSDEQDKIIRLKHEKLGAELARYLLRKATHDSKLTQEICKIIDGHDTRRRYDNSKKFLSKNDGLVQDADKLWRVSRKGMLVNMKRKNLTALQYYNLASKINGSGYFYSKTAKKIAKDELKKRKIEFGI